jgi:hypothetical protein
MSGPAASGTPTLDDCVMKQVVRVGLSSRVLVHRATPVQRAGPPEQHDDATAGRPSWDLSSANTA